jgi:Sec-independent protein secretion pathway component TatC
MDSNRKTTKRKDRKVILSTLWIVVMFNMIFADILSFMKPGFLKDIMTGSTEIQITQGLLLLFAVLLEIPIAMIFLSRVLNYRANRWVNIIASVITIAFVIGMGTTDLHYIFFATIEAVSMLLIIWYAWKLPKQEA